MLRLKGVLSWLVLVMQILATVLYREGVAGSIFYLNGVYWIWVY